MAKKALVVDDDQIARDLASLLLSEEGFEVETVADGNLALDAVRIHRPAVVILDILMPGVDGLTVCRQIKRDPDLTEVKVVMVSAKNRAEDHARAAEYGADLIIPKPYKVEMFSRLVRSLVGLPERSEQEK